MSKVNAGRYKVIYISKEGHKWEFSTEASDEEEAVKNAQKFLDGLHWEVYGYELKEILEG